MPCTPQGKRRRFQASRALTSNRRQQHHGMASVSVALLPAAVSVVFRGLALHRVREFRLALKRRRVEERAPSLVVAASRKRQYPARPRPRLALSRRNSQGAVTSKRRPSGSIIIARADGELVFGITEIPFAGEEYPLNNGDICLRWRVAREARAGMLCEIKARASPSWLKITKSRYGEAVEVPASRRESCLP